MALLIKTRDKATLDDAQRRYFWSLTPYERLTLAQRLNQQAQAVYAANPANPPLAADPGRVLKSSTPIPAQARWAGAGGEDDLAD